MPISSVKGPAPLLKQREMPSVSNQSPNIAAGAVSPSLLRQNSGPELRPIHSNGPLSRQSGRQAHASLAERSHIFGTSRSTPVAAEPPRAMYGADGKLNSSVMNEVLSSVKNVLRTLNPNESKAGRLIDRTLKDKTLAEPKKLYSALKDISHAIGRNKGNEHLQFLAAAVMQMARAQNYQVGISEYDSVGEAATAKYQKKNPTIELRSNAFAQDVQTLGAHGGVKLGADAGVADAASAGVNLGVSLSRTKMLLNDFDTDVLHINKKQIAVSLSAIGTVGELSKDLQTANLSGALDLKMIRGAMVEGQKVKDVVNYTIMHAREGGDVHSPTLKPNKSELKSLANLSTRGVTATLAGVVRGLKSRLWNAQTADRQTALNSHKLLKGGTPSLFLVKDNSLLKGIPGCIELQKQLDDAYGAMRLRKRPDSFKPVVGDAAWFEVEGNFSGNATALKIDLGHDVTIAGGGVALSLAATHRKLPYKLWMAPHVALQALSDGNTNFKRDLLQQVRTADPSIADYLDKIQNSGLRQLSRDIQTFEELAHELLSMQGVIRGGDSSSVLREHAQNHFDRGLKTLKNTFKLKPFELKGLDADSERLEPTLARCWNRLSLGHAIKSLDTHESQEPLQVQLGQRINEPNILMAPTHLYHASSLQLEATLLRSRKIGSLTVTLPGIQYGNPTSSAGASLPSLGHLSATLTHDTISQHPNLVRNGKFLTADLSATHLPGLRVMDTVAHNIAVLIVKQLQPGTDAKQLSENEHAALVGSISATLMAGLANPVKSEVGTSASISRQFEVGLQQSGPGEPWRLCYFQSSNVESRASGIKGAVSMATGLGGNVGLQVGTSTTSNVVRPPILGSAPSYHILQLPRFAQALCDATGSSTLDDEKTVFEKLRTHDVASMYFSNDAILDQLDLMHKLKQDKKASTDVFGRLALLPQNKDQYATFATSGLNATDLQRKINDARKITKDTDMDRRLKYFTTDEGGRELLQEYASGMVQLAVMKGRASMLEANMDKRAMKASIQDSAGDKVAMDLSLPNRTPTPR